MVCSVPSSIVPNTLSALNELETHFIIYLRAVGDGYNFTNGGDCRTPSDATRKKMRDSHLGKGKGREVSQATREKLRVINTGKKLSEEHIEKLRKAAIGRTSYNKGRFGYKTKPASVERKQKIGAAQMGKKNHNFGKVTPESVKEKIRKSNCGEKCYLAKLTDEQVSEIKSRLLSGEKGVNLATEFSVAATQISSIKNGKTWRHIK